MALPCTTTPLLVARLLLRMGMDKESLQDELQSVSMECHHDADDRPGRAMNLHKLAEAIQDKLEDL